MLTSFRGKHVLLLQGPMGPFFWRLRKDLEEAGARVSKINFCAADALYYPSGAIPYRGSLAGWPGFFRDLAIREKVQAVLLFGDCRPYHYAIRDIARLLEVELLVFEEGYLRPSFITIERGGVNNHSRIPRDPESFRRAERGNLRFLRRPVHEATGTFSRAAVYATFYSIANFLFAWAYPHYQHHRPLNPFHQAAVWIRGLFRKYWFKATEAHLLPQLTNGLDKRYFLVPLQVHNDAQVTNHSDFEHIEEFMARVAESFAAHAPADEALVFKHHPMDRPYRDYGKLISDLGRRCGLQGRIHYVHDLHLPTLLRHARGSVVINSTVGLSSAQHGTPVITLGDPVYNMPGLTFQGSLDDFWRDPGTVDSRLCESFRSWLIAHNQANGSFYKKLNEADNHAGVIWPPLGAAFETEHAVRKQVRRRKARLQAATGVGRGTRVGTFGH